MSHFKISKRKNMMDYFIAWWNLENLFDVFDSDERPEWLQKKLNKELKGWDGAVLQKKIEQLVSIISIMNDGNGPDLLGVCEVESKAVLDRLTSEIELPNRDYSIVHSDAKDARGIDVAFIYDSNLFRKPAKKDVFNHVVLKRNATRDIVQVNFKTKRNPSSDLVIIGNHWPSKLGGDLESEPYRIIAAETLSYWIERIYAKFQKEVPIVVMGDFNDEPFDRSITQYALGQKDSSIVKSKRAKKPYLLNLMWPLQKDNSGTHYFNGWGMLDQILVNRPLLRNESNLKLVPNSCGIFKTQAMLKSGKPRRFSRPSAKKGHDPEGFSDHLPAFVRIEEN